MSVDWRYVLTRLQRFALDAVLGVVDHELEHEAAHLTLVAVVCGSVVRQGDVAGALQQRIEIIRIDGDLIFDGRHLEATAQ